MEIKFEQKGWSGQSLFIFWLGMAVGAFVLIIGTVTITAGINGDAFSSQSEIFQATGFMLVMSIGSMIGGYALASHQAKLDAKAKELKQVPSPTPPKQETSEQEIC